MSAVQDALRNRVFYDARIPDEHVAEKCVVGALSIITSVADVYSWYIPRHATRSSIEQAARDNMLYCQYGMLAAIGTLSLYWWSFVLAHFIHHPCCMLRNLRIDHLNITLLASMGVTLINFVSCRKLNLLLRLST